jgi:hypothetical protein
VGDGEVEKRIEFIIEQQAQFASDIQILRERQSHLTDALVTVVGIVGQLAEAQQRTDARLGELAAHADEKFAQLAEAQARTDDRLNVLIDAVEKFVSRNGHGNSEPAEGP